jgi:hypothetical protein
MIYILIDQVTLPVHFYNPGPQSTLLKENIDSGAGQARTTGHTPVAQLLYFLQHLSGKSQGRHLQWAVVQMQISDGAR